MAGGPAHNAGAGSLMDWPGVRVARCRRSVATPGAMPPWNRRSLPLGSVPRVFRQASGLGECSRQPWSAAVVSLRWAGQPWSPPRWQEPLLDPGMHRCFGAARRGPFFRRRRMLPTHLVLQRCACRVKGKFAVLFLPRRLLYTGHAFRHGGRRPSRWPCVGVLWIGRLVHRSWSCRNVVCHSRRQQQR